MSVYIASHFHSVPFALSKCLGVVLLNFIKFVHSHRISGVLHQCRIYIKKLGFQSLMFGIGLGGGNRTYLNSHLSTMILSNNLKEGTHRKVPDDVKEKKIKNIVTSLQSSRFLLVRWGFTEDLPYGS